jgi:hypothetical protein
MGKYPPEAWERLGAALRKRRGQLGYGFRQRGTFARDRGGKLSAKTLSRLEHGERPGLYADETLTLAEVIYGLEPGSIEAFLDGGELMPADGRPEPAPAPRPMTDVMVWVAARMRAQGRPLDDAEALFRHLGWHRDSRMKAPADITAREARVIAAELGVNAREVYEQLGLLDAGDLDARGPLPPAARSNPGDESNWGQARKA